MDFSIMDSCQIANLRPIFGRGFRGETLAAARNRKWMDVLIRAGVNTIIDLRTADHNDKLAQGCAVAGLAYHHIPVDGQVRGAEEMASDLPTLFGLLDSEGFYISCQQGMHRTDIALALCYFFHDDSEIPLMFGHRKNGVLRCDDILRRVNLMRPYFPDVADDAFEVRRKRFLAFNRKFDEDWLLKYGESGLMKSLVRMVGRNCPTSPSLRKRMVQLLEDAQKGECWFSSKVPYVNVLSNFYPCSVEFEGVTYPTAEHAYQIQKFPAGSEARERLMAQRSGSDVKSLADFLKAWMRPDWDEKTKVEVMRQILESKFAQHPELRKVYENIRSLKLIHESNGDRFWGRSRKGVGKNVLGDMIADVFQSHV